MEERLGILEIVDKGFGFLRQPEQDLAPAGDDAYLPRNLIQSLGLRLGQEVLAQVSQAGRGKVAVKKVLSVNGLDPEAARQLPQFRSLTSIAPNQRIRLETGPEPLSMRLVDLMTPIGRGSRGLIVAPPRTGKTTLLKQMAQAVSTNHPDVRVTALLVDERPEEVTDLRRSIKGQVIASSLDQAADRHRRLAELVAASARCQVEAGEHVFLILDSITRLARAFNASARSGGRTLSGGLDARAMEIPRQIFGSARATEEAGSLTIIATALIETGSRMDELIFHEFKGTGNLELVLDRKLADGRIWPAVNILESGTRREELLQDQLESRGAALLRRALSSLHPAQAAERLISFLEAHPGNNSLLEDVVRAA